MIKKSTKIVALSSILGIFIFAFALHNNLLLLPFSGISHVNYVTDFSNDKMLMGASHNVFIGRVVKQVGTKSLNFGPETQFSVEVISSIKGNLSGTVTVNQFAGYKNGVLYLLKGDVSAPEKSGNSASEVDKLLEPGKTYLFASRYNSEQNWHTLVSHPNARKLISSDKKLTLTQLQGLVEKDTRVAQLREAYKNEILLDVDVASNNTRNSYVSTHPVTTSKSVPTTTKTK